MLKIAIYLADQNPHRDRSMGITNMTDCLISKIERRNDVQLTVITSKSSYVPPGSHEGNREATLLRQVHLPWRTDHRIARVLTDNLHPFLVKRSFDLWYYPKGVVSYVTRPREITVGTIHDVHLQHYADHYPDYRSTFDYTYWLGLLKASIRKLDLILTVSEHSRSHILQFSNRHGLSAPPIVVTYEGSPYERFSCESPLEKGDFVLHLASQEPHKKTAHFLKMWRRLSKCGESLPPLKLVGSLPDEVIPLARQNPNIQWLPKQPEDDFVRLMRSAQALVIPSELEGFGLPALEAYYLGTPVCYVQETSVDEILNVGGLGGFSLENDGSLLRALERVRQLSRGEVQQISNRLRKEYALEKIADRLVGAFQKAIEIGGS